MTVWNSTALIASLTNLSLLNSCTMQIQIQIEFIYGSQLTKKNCPGALTNVKMQDGIDEF